MANVVGVTPKGEKAAMIQLDDGPPVWCPDLEAAKKLVAGEPIPSDWTRKVGDYGPQAFPPRPKKDKAFSVAYRNTAEGQAYEQERMDRRTALMQAIAYTGPHDYNDVIVPPPTLMADDFYAWLRKTAGDVVAPASTSPAPKSEQKVPRETTSVMGGSDDTGTGGGSGEAPAPGTHTHEGSPLKMDGSELSNGRLRCIQCGVVSKSGGLW